MKHEIIFENTSQTLVHIPPVRVASATYLIERMNVAQENADRTIAGGSATLDTASEAITAAAGPSQVDATKMSMADTTGFSVGNFYAIQHGASTGVEETFECIAVSSNAYILAAHPLSQDYPITTSTVKGIQLTASFPDATAADEDYIKGPYPIRVIWEYALNGVTLPFQEQVEIVRYKGSDLDLAQCVADVKDMWPNIEAISERKGTNAILKAATLTQRRIEVKLKAKNDEPLLFLTGEQGRWAMMWGAMKFLAQFGLSPGNRPTEDFMTECEAGFTEAFHDLTIGEPGHDAMEVEKNEDVSIAGEVKYRHTFTPS